MSDAELIARVIISDDHAAFGELVARHQSAVRHFLRHLTRGDTALADDLAQETFVHGYRKMSDFHGHSLFSTWLLGIAHNHWRNARRLQRSVPLEPEHMCRLETVPASTPLSDLKADITQAMSALTTDEQAVFHLHYQQGFSHPEIATVLACPLGTVKTHLNRGREKLRPLLASWNHQT